MALVGNEIVYVIGVTATGTPSGEAFRTTTQAIANLGSGGGISSQYIVSSGISYTTLVAAISIAWNSANAAAKTQIIPASTGSLAIIEVSDAYGSAGQYPIMIVPQTGSIIGVNQVYTPYGSVTVRDLSIGWISI